ncbi:hypothetical protein [Burkholderia phage vB_BpP_HN03]|uniref:Uncharacterized protein n=1 Tax=Burkholderia phage vB_BpP_HN02 TaxID=3116925 RepID=A0AAX4JIH1_9CAUD
MDIPQNLIYKVTGRVTQLVEDLMNQGYKGDIRFTQSYASGCVLKQGTVSVELTGFCKETLCLVEDIEDAGVVGFGRYGDSVSNLTVESLVRHAYFNYKQYKKSKNYPMPEEFKDLFLKYGLIRIENQPVIIES